MIYDDKSFHPDMIENPEVHQKIIDALPIPIFYRDIRGVYIASNKAYEKFIGLSKSQLIGKTIFDLQPKELAEIYSALDQELIENPGEQVYETKFQFTDGSMHDVVFNKNAILNDEGKVIGIVGSISDITDLKKAERRMEKAKEAAVIASAMMHKIQAGIIIVNQDFKVIDSNEGFAQLFGEETMELYEAIPGLNGADFKELVPEVVYKMFASLMASGENALERDLRIHNKLMHVSVVTIQKNRVVGALIRDMSAPSLVREEIISRAQRVNKQNLETVQKIAFLLGENASLTEELLNSIIESYKYGEE